MRWWALKLYTLVFKLQYNINGKVATNKMPCTLGISENIASSTNCSIMTINNCEYNENNHVVAAYITTTLNL